MGLIRIKRDKINNSYNEDSIQHFKGLDGMRKRPTTYIGELGSAGVKHLFLEAIGNSLDEFNAGYGNKIYIDINEKERFIKVKDLGRGIPLGSIVQVLTKMHAGGKFNKNAYKMSIGLNGLGLKCINALSTKTIVVVNRDGKTYKQEFFKGKEGNHKITKSKDSSITGTEVLFYPDEEVLGKFKINSKDLIDLVTKLSYMNKGCKFIFNYLMENSKEYKKKIIYSENGLIDYIETLSKNNLFKSPYIFKDKTDNDKDNQSYSIEILFNYNSKNTEDIIRTFVNGIEMTEHGTHLTGTLMGLSQVINKYITDNNLIPKKDQNKIKLDSNDIKEGLILVINVNHSDPLFSNQVKNKLINTNIQGLAKKTVIEKLNTLLVKDKNKAKLLCNQIISNCKGRLAAQRAKIATKKATNPFTLVSNISKFKNCNSKDPNKCELFIVEGNSAGGSATDGRNPEYQAIYCLRGKPVNTFDKDQSDILNTIRSEEFRNIVNILGTGIGRNFDIEKLKFKRIIVMCDADVDAFHIISLMLTFFYKHMPKLVRNMNIYIAQPPLYKIKENKKDIYIKDRKEYNKYLVKRILKKFNIYKDKNVLNKNEIIKELDIYNNELEEKLNILASEFSINKELLNVILEKIIKKEKINFKNNGNKYKELKVTKDKNDNIIISGTYNDEYQSITLNKKFYRLIKNIREVYENIIGSYKIKDENNNVIYKNINFYKMITYIIKEVTPKYLQRFKGLGEQNPEELFETTMNPKTRKLVQVKEEDYDETMKSFKIIMGKSADERKEWILNNEIDFSDVDVV